MLKLFNNIFISLLFTFISNISVQYVDINLGEKKTIQIEQSEVIITTKITQKGSIRFDIEPLASDSDILGNVFYYISNLMDKQELPFSELNMVKSDRFGYVSYFIFLHFEDEDKDKLLFIKIKELKIGDQIKVLLEYFTPGQMTIVSVILIILVIGLIIALIIEIYKIIKKCIHKFCSK